MAVECELLDKREVRDAAALLTRAFGTDGIISYYFRDPRRRRLAAPALFRAVVQEHMAYGSVYGARDGARLVGVAIWAPPDPPRLARRVRLRTSLSLLAARGLFPFRARPLLHGLSELAGLHPTEPHWYLVFAAVEPERQGGGIGRALLSPVIEEAERGGVMAYLETPFPETHAFYEGLGFEITATVDPFPEARPMTIMVRPAR